MEASNAEFLAKAAILYDDAEYGSGWEHAFRFRANISERTLRRWKDGHRLPGPVRAMILAHEKCLKYRVEV